MFKIRVNKVKDIIILQITYHAIRPTCSNKTKIDQNYNNCVRNLHHLLATEKITILFRNQKGC